MSHEPQTLDYDEYDTLLQAGQTYETELPHIRGTVGQWGAGRYRLPNGDALDVYGNGYATRYPADNPMAATTVPTSGLYAPATEILLMENLDRAEAAIRDAARTLARARADALDAAYGRHATARTMSRGETLNARAQRALDALAGGV